MWYSSTTKPAYITDEQAINQVELLLLRKLQAKHADGASEFDLNKIHTALEEIKTLP